MGSDVTETIDARWLRCLSVNLTRIVYLSTGRCGVYFSFHCDVQRWNSRIRFASARIFRSALVRNRRVDIIWNNNNIGCFDSHELSLLVR